MTYFLNAINSYYRGIFLTRIAESAISGKTLESINSFKVKRKNGQLLLRLSSKHILENSRQLTRIRASEGLNETSTKCLNPVLSLNDFDFDVPFAKKVFLSFWVKKHLIVQPGHHTQTSELYKLYKRDLDKEFTYEPLLDERIFFQDIATVMAIFGIKPVKIRMTGGRGYVGVRYVDQSEDHFNENSSKIVMELEMESASSSYNRN